MNDASSTILNEDHALFPAALNERAVRLLDLCRTRGVKIATAESCTGGLIIGLLTEIPGSSDVVDRGFVTYSNAAKNESLGVPAALITQLGAVSRQVAAAMAQGALTYSRADVAVAVTGVAGPGGGSEAKPVGLVYIAARTRNGTALIKECRFGEDIGRGAIRMATINEALGLIEQVLAEPPLPPTG